VEGSYSCAEKLAKTLREFLNIPAGKDERGYGKT